VIERVVLVEYENIIKQVKSSVMRNGW